MASVLKFYTKVSGKTLSLPDLSAFEGKRVEVLIVVDEEAVAHNNALPPDQESKRTRRFGTMAGQIVISDDFDAPLPEDVLAAFEGKALL